MKRTLASAFIISILSLSGCADQQSLEQIKNDLKEIKQQQATVMEKLTKLETRAPAAAPQEPTGPVTVTAKNAAVKGDPKAPAVIVAWSDFQCPFCSKVLPVIDETLEAPEVKGKVAFVFKHFPLSFHKAAEPAARAAMAAGRQGKFFPMHDKIFANQKALSEENYALWAKELGLDVDKFKKDMADPAFAQQVKDEMAEGTKAGVRGTPTIFIGTNNGDTYTIVKAQGRSVDVYKKMILDALAKKPA